MYCQTPNLLPSLQRTKPQVLSPFGPKACAKNDLSSFSALFCIGKAFMLPYTGCHWRCHKIRRATTSRGENDWKPHKPHIPKVVVC